MIGPSAHLREAPPTDPGIKPIRANLTAICTVSPRLQFSLGLRSGPVEGDFQRTFADGLTLSTDDAT